MKVSSDLGFWAIPVCLLVPSIALATNHRSETCPSGSHWVRAHHRRAYVRVDGAQVRETWVKAHCAENPAGFDFWNSRIRDVRPDGWPNPGEKSKKWTDEERERVIEALAALPEALRSRALQGIYRMERSKDFLNPASNEPGQIALYDSAFDSKRNLSRILAHELGHQEYQNLSDEDGRGYRLSTNWLSVDTDSRGREMWLSRKGTFVEEDGEISPEEDFSNNVEYFLFDPGKLKSVTPHAYNWIGDHYGPKFRLAKDGKNGK